MAQQTQVRERAVKASIYGSGHEHYHVILSKSRGLDRVMAVATFDNYQDAGVRAHAVKAEYERMGFTAREYGMGQYLDLVKAGETASHLTTRRCHLRHNIDG